MSSLAFSHTRVYEPRIRALLGTASHFCKGVILKLTLLACSLTLQGRECRGTDARFNVKSRQVYGVFSEPASLSLSLFLSLSLSHTHTHTLTQSLGGAGVRGVPEHAGHQRFAHTHTHTRTHTYTHTHTHKRTRDAAASTSHSRSLSSSTCFGVEGLG